MEFSARELHAIARMTGSLLGYAVPDRNYDPELIVSIFNRTSQKLSDVLMATVSVSKPQDHYYDRRGG
jgi:hypothetical protein